MEPQLKVGAESASRVGARVGIPAHPDGSGAEGESTWKPELPRDAWLKAHRREAVRRGTDGQPVGRCRSLHVERRDDADVPGRNCGGRNEEEGWCCVGASSGIVRDRRSCEWTRL